MSTVADKIDALPAPEELLRRAKNLAEADRIRIPSEASAWQRLYRFEENWETSAHYASLNDGEGNLYGMVFNHDGVFVWGFDNESDYSTYGTEEPQPALEGLPEVFEDYLTNPEFSDDVNDPQIFATVAFWWNKKTESWDYNSDFVNDELDGFDDGGYSYLFDIFNNYDVELYWKKINGNDNDTGALTLDKAESILAAE